MNRKTKLILQSNNSFTLVELLIVIGILAILTAAVVIAINPAELLKQARDSQRMQDLSSVDKALSVIETMNPSADFGTAFTIYVSIPDTSATCANLGLPTLPSGWAYACVTEENLHNSNGTGWIPVDFTNSYGTLSLSSLPTDPTNTTSTRQYYTYVTGGSWKLATILESTKYQATQAKDGGSDYATYEKGSDLTLAPFTHGLLGWWRFEGDFTDSSGMGNDGTGQNGVTFADGYSGQAAFFDGVDDRIAIPIIRPASQDITVAMWINVASGLVDGTRIRTASPWEINAGTNNTWYPSIRYPCYMLYSGWGWCGATRAEILAKTTFDFDHWEMIAMTFDHDKVRHYVNGQLVSQTSSMTGAVPAGKPYADDFGFAPENSGFYFDGLIDEIRVYDRALSDVEMEAMYDIVK